MKSLSDQRSYILSQLNEAYEGRVSDVKQSLLLAQNALKNARELKDSSLIGKCLNHVSLFYMIVGENQLSLDASKEAIDCFTKLHDELGIADAKFNIGSVYYKTDNYHMGLINLVDSMAIYKKYEAYGKLSRVHKTLGTIYEFFGDENKAIKSYQFAIDAARKVGDLNLESNAYNPLSGIYLDKNDIEKAIELIEDSIRIKNQTGDIRGMAFAIYGRGKIHTQTKNFEAAEHDFKKAESIHLQMGEKLGLAMTYYKLGVLMSVMGKPQKALKVLLKGRAFCIEHNISQFKYKCDFLLYQAYKKMGDIEKSMFYLEEHLAVKEAVINVETLKIIENYELISQQQLIENEELKKANAELDQFVYRVSHDLRAPLSSILGLVSLGLEMDDRTDVNQCFEMIKNRAEAQDYFIKEIEEYSRNARLAPNFKKIVIKKLISEIIESLIFIEGAQSINFSVQGDKNMTVRSDPFRIKSIVNNLITNAIKYHDPTKSNQFINISYQLLERNWTLVVEDNGIGIVSDRQDKVFDMFYRGTEQSNGSGLGLFIVKETVEKIGGKIEFESKYGSGSRFITTLPLDNF